MMWTAEGKCLTVQTHLFWSSTPGTMSSIEGMDRAFIGQGTTHKILAESCQSIKAGWGGNAGCDRSDPSIHPRPMFRPLCLFAGVEALSLCLVHAGYFSVAAHELRGEGGTYARSRWKHLETKKWGPHTKMLDIWQIRFGTWKTIFKGSDYVTWREGSILIRWGIMDWGQNFLHLKMDFWKKVRSDLIPWMKIRLSDMCWLQKVWCFMEVVMADCQINAFGSLWLSTLIHHPATVVHTFLLSPSVHIVIQCMR